MGIKAHLINAFVVLTNGKRNKFSVFQLSGPLKADIQQVIIIIIKPQTLPAA